MNVEFWLCSAPARVVRAAALCQLPYACYVRVEGQGYTAQELRGAGQGFTRNPLCGKEKE